MRTARHVFVTLFVTIAALFAIVALPVVAHAKGKINIDNVDITVSTVPYTGKDVSAAFVLEYDNEALEYGTDYTAKFYDYNDRMVTPLKVGDYTMVVTGQGRFDSQVTFWVRVIDLYDLDSYDSYSYFSGDEIFYDGNPHPWCPSSIEVDGYEIYLGKHYEIDHFEYYVEDEQNAHYNEWIEVEEPIEVGEYNVILKGIAPYHGTFTTSYMIYDTYDITQLSLCVYNAYTNCNPVKPDIELMSVSGDMLVEGVDYTIEGYQFWDENAGDGGDFVNATLGSTSTPGAYMVTIEGISPYHGTRSETFGLYDGYDLDVAYGYAGSVWFSGEPVEPEISVAVDGKELVRGTDYTVSYVHDDGHTAIAPDTTGDWTAIFTGISPYHGTIEDSFTVRSIYDLNNGRTYDTRFYMDQEDEPSFEVYINGILVPADAYTVTYIEEDEYYNGSATPLAEGEEFQFGHNYVAQLKAAKAPYTGKLKVFFRASASNDLYYALVYDPLEDIVLQNGSAHPQFEVKLGTKTLIEGTDYTMRYWYFDQEEEETIPVDEITQTGYFYAAAVACPGSNYQGGMDEDNAHGFAVISPYDFNYASAAIDYWQYRPYTGERILLPSFDVTLAGKKLTEGVDYRIVYEESNDEQTIVEGGPIEPAFYYVKCVGIAPYYGEYEACYLVIYRDDGNLTKGDTELYTLKHRYAHTGQPVVPNVTLTYYGKTLTEGTDYTLSYDTGTTAPTEVGEHTVYAHGIGSYSGKASCTFVIAEPNDLDASATVDIGESAKAYTGSTIKPVPTVTLADGTVLTAGVDYTVNYYVNACAGVPYVDEGMFEVMATGTGAYTGSTYATYSIVRPEHNLANAQISGIDAVYAYDDAPIKLAYEVSLGNNVLRPNRDYGTRLLVKNGNGWFDCSSDDRIEAPGHYKLVIGVSNYYGYPTYLGTKEIEFDVTDGEPIEPPTPQKTDLSGATIELEKSEYEFDGTAHRPSVTVKLAGKTLTPGTDYTVTYSNNINVGTRATVKVFGTGDYEGEATTYFTIVAPPQPPSDDYDALLATLNGELATATSAVTNAEAEQTAAAAAVEAAQAALDAADDAVESAEQAVADAQSELNNANTTLSSAQSAKSQADAAVASKAAEITSAETAKAEAEASLPGKQTAAANAQTVVNERQAALTAAQQRKAAAQAAVDADSQVPTANKEAWTLLGLFKYIRDNTTYGSAAYWDARCGIAILTGEAVPTSEHEYGQYQGFAQDGESQSMYGYDNENAYQKVLLSDRGDAVSLDNVDASLDFIDSYNSYREHENQAEGCSLDTNIGTNCRMLAISAVQCDWSKDTYLTTGKLDHSECYYIGENISRGRSNPFDGWYTNEKSVFKQKWQPGVDIMQIQGVGHYLNIVDWHYDSDYHASYAASVTGFACNTRSGMPLHEQSFYTLGEYFPVSVIYTTDEFRSLWFDDYYDAQIEDGMFGATEESQAAHLQELADATAAVTAAEQALASAQSAKQAADNEVTTTQTTISNLTSQIAQLTSEKQTLEAQAAQAAANVTTAQSAVATATANLNTAQATLDELEDDPEYQQLQTALTQAQARKDSADADVATALSTKQAAADRLDDATDLSDVAVAGLTSMTYTGYGLTPPVTVTKTFEGTTYTLGTPAHYSVAYSDNTDPGTAKVTVSGKGTKGSGTTWNSKLATFAIIGVSIDDVTVAPINARTYTGIQIQPVPALSYEGTPLTNGTDFTIKSYGPNTNVGEGSVVVEGKGVYTGTRTITFTINPASLGSATVSAAAVTYDGTQQTPTPSVKLGTKTLSSSDYRVTSYGANVNAGTGAGTIAIQGIGNYTGTASGSFDILPKSLANARVSAADQTYDGNAKTPAVSVRLEGTEIGAANYTVAYDNNTNATNSARITVTGKGNYTGTASGTFVINRASIDGAVVNIANQTYTGEELLPIAEVLLNGKRLAGSDFMYMSDVAIDAGTYSVSVFGRNNYTGICDGWFTIDPASIAQAKVTVDAQDFDGTPKTPEPTVTLGGKTLVAGTDYDNVVYDNNTNVGTAHVTVTGKGNYTGDVTGSFEIKMESLVKWARLSGQNALATMLDIAKEFVRRFGKTDVAIVTTNADFRDALAASALAGRYKALVLTTAKGSLSAETRTALTTAGVKTVYIVGSASDVSDKVLKQVEKVSGFTKVKRIGGKSPSAKAIALGKELGTAKSKTVIIAMQGSSAKKLSFKDALSIAPYSYATKTQILYAEYNKTLSKDTAAYIKKEKFTKAIIVGGPVALPEAIEKQLKDAGVKAANITRLAGGDSYETSEIIAKWACGQYKNGTTVGKYNGKALTTIRFQPATKMSPNGLSIATSQSWKDALCGAALAGRGGTVLILADDTGGNHYGRATAFCAAHKAAMTEAYVLGGNLSVSDAVWEALVDSTRA